uniref:IF rod domain-containing protein n=1 Tax=Macrostomum lignano TaxID=282301 RepID=A0A1I8FQY6_9PLAT
LDEANRQHQVDRETIDKLNQQLADYDGEISLLRAAGCHLRRGAQQRDQKEIKRLRDEVNRLRGDLDAETLNHINAENEAQSLREQLEFMKQIHESELKELAALAYRDTTSENREFWKNEMAQALHEIQREYDNKMDVMRSEIESQYSMKMTDARNRIPELEARNAQLERELEELRREMEEAERECEMEKGRLRTDLANTQATLEEYLKELQTLMDMKLSLELEIAAYRKLLEGEETRINQHHRTQELMSQKSSTVESRSFAVEQQAMHQGQMSLIKGEMSAKTTYPAHRQGQQGGHQLVGDCCVTSTTADKSSSSPVPNGVVLGDGPPQEHPDLGSRTESRPAATTWKLLSPAVGVGANINT